MKEQSTLERTFATRWLQLASGYPEPETEYHFWQGRNWRFDFAFPAYFIAVEMEGIGGGKSRHTSFKGYSDDCDKYNHATVAGWKVLRFTGKMITDEPEFCINMVRLLIDQKQS